MNPHLRRWMMFVDGENLTIEAQKLAAAHSVVLQEGKTFSRDKYFWFPNENPRQALIVSGSIQLQPFAVRSYYYTSVVGDETMRLSVKRSLWNLGFTPEVFQKAKGHKSKGVDITLTKDLLSHAFLDNYDVAVLVAGDGDYVPLIEGVKRLGKIVYVAFFLGQGLNADLHLASDTFFDMTVTFRERVMSRKN